MKHVTAITRALLGTVAIFLAGCQTRSISNSGYPGQNRGSYHESYHGELSQFDIIGVDPGKLTTEADIQTALRSTAQAALTPESRILLIQSGAEFPDAPMLAALKEHYPVAPFSGRPVPERRQAAIEIDPIKRHEPASFSRNLRLAAARGGYDKIVCYWGILESARENHLTALVSWVPIVGYTIPDKTDHMRLQLKAVIVDVATGNWALVSPPPLESSSVSTVLSRKETDQALVQRLKTEGYRSLAQSLRDSQQVHVANATP